MTEEQQPLKGQPEPDPASTDKLASGVRNQADIDLILCVRRAVERTLSTMCHISLVEKPTIELKPVVKWMGKMRVIKPLDCAFVSVITFRHGAAKRKIYEVNGFIVLYIPETTADELIKALGLSGTFDEDDIKDACGEFLNIMAGSFKLELVKVGYEELEISPPFNFGFKVDELFDYYQDYKFDLTFFKEGKTYLHVDIALDKIVKGNG